MTQDLITHLTEAVEQARTDRQREHHRVMARRAFEDKTNAMADGRRERADRFDHEPPRGAQHKAAIAANLAEWED